MAGTIHGGSVAIVTGGASGIGAEIVRALRSSGAAVVLGDVNEAAGDELALETGATFQRTDVRQPANHVDLVARAVDQHGGLDHAFLNAGILGIPIAEHFNGVPFDPATADAERYRMTMEVNVDGVVHGIAAAVPALRARGGGGIVATASVAGLVPYSPDPWYSASKHAVVGYVRSVAQNLRGDGITVNAICPGGVATPMTGFGDDMDPAVMLPPSAVAAAQLDAATTDATGQCFTIIARQGVQQHQFSIVEGF
ncbi:MAG: SDR family NAD(P)-dependent oxidoreductase [Actinomycetota bacterium]|nr:SDR family NAD(P)-dependent oxidoreductase [Actinomycetota bacterium]